MNKLPYWQNSLKGVKKEIVDKGNVREGDGVKSGEKSSSGGSVDSSMLLTRNFPNGKLTIPAGTTLGLNAIAFDENLYYLKFEDGAKVSSPIINLDNQRSAQTSFTPYYAYQNINSQLGDLEPVFFPIVSFYGLNNGYGPYEFKIGSSVALLSQLYDANMVIECISRREEDLKEEFQTLYPENTTISSAWWIGIEYLWIRTNNPPFDGVYLEYDEETGTLLNNYFSPLEFKPNKTLVPLIWQLEDLYITDAEAAELQLELITSRDDLEDYLSDHLSAVVIKTTITKSDDNTKYLYVPYEDYALSLYDKGTVENVSFRENTFYYAPNLRSNSKFRDAIRANLEKLPFYSMNPKLEQILPPSMLEEVQAKIEANRKKVGLSEDSNVIDKKDEGKPLFENDSDIIKDIDRGE